MCILRAKPLGSQKNQLRVTFLTQVLLLLGLVAANCCHIAADETDAGKLEIKSVMARLQDQNERESRRKERLQTAQKLMDEGDVKGAAAELEKVLSDTPNDAALLFNIAGLIHQGTESEAGGRDYEACRKAAAYLRRALKANPRIAETAYRGGIAAAILKDDACGLAKERKPADALMVLQQAVAIGFVSISGLEVDEDLESVRALPEFPALVAKARESGREYLKKEVARILSETKPFAFTFKATDIDGNPIAMSDLHGHVVIIDVWGTWCPPCRAEIPHLVELQNKYKNAGLIVVGLNKEFGQDENRGLKKDEELDRKVASKIVSDFRKKTGLNFRCVLADRGMLEQIPAFRSFPTMLFIDRSGQVRAKVVGYRDIETLEAIVFRLLEEKSDEKTP